MSPLSLSFRCKAPQIGFHTLVDNFSLTISTEMIGGSEMKLGALEMEEFFPKIVGISGISIRDNIMRHAMKLENIIHENLSHRGCCERVLESTKMSIFGKMINYQHDE
jgi:hypothetical protein